MSIRPMIKFFTLAEEPCISTAPATQALYIDQRRDALLLETP